MSDEKMSAIAGAINASKAVRDVKTDGIVSAVMKGFTSRNSFHVDTDALLQEMRNFRSCKPLPNFQLEGSDSLATATEWRVLCRNDRARCIAIMDDLRDASGRVKRMFRILKPHLREVLHDQAAKAADEIIAVALDPMFSTLEDYKDLMTTCSEAIGTIDDTHRTLDALFSLHKQHVFLTGATIDPEKPHHRQKEGKGFKRAG